MENNRSVLNSTSKLPWQAIVVVVTFVIFVFLGTSTNSDARHHDSIVNSNPSSIAQTRNAERQIENYSDKTLPKKSFTGDLLVCKSVLKLEGGKCAQDTVEVSEVSASSTVTERISVINVSTFGRETPLISALCVSHHRPQMLRRAIRLWAAQTYPRLELVVVYDADDEQTKVEAVAAAHQYTGSGGMTVRRVTLVENTDRSVKLGHLRNRAVAAASGDLVMQWDDDDVHLPTRVAHSLSAQRCSKRPVVMLDSWIVVHYHTRSGSSYNGKMYIAPTGLQPGSILAPRNLLENCYPQNITRSATDGEVGEDSVCANALVAAGHVAAIHAPQLYIYLNHGNNTCSYKHFKWLAMRSGRQKQLHFSEERRVELEGLIARITSTDEKKGVTNAIHSLARYVDKSWVLRGCSHTTS